MNELFFPKLLVSLCLFLNTSLLWAQSSSKGPSVAQVMKIKGAVLIDEIPLKMGDNVHEGDTLRTQKGGFIRLAFEDKTFVNIGSESEFHVKSYRKVEGRRKNNLRILKGKVRIWVNKIAGPGEEINVNAQQVALGVRGTEFLVNAYNVGGAPSSDVLLVKGSLKASGAGFNAFTMEPGQFFNSQDLLRNGMKALKTLSAEALSKIKGSMESFIPELQTPNGFLNLGASTLSAAGGAVAGLATGLLAGGSSRDEKEKPPVVEKVKPVAKPVKAAKEAKRKTDTTVKGVLDFTYDLKKEKWDIRDAVINRAKNKKDNKCFYFFYKQLPGAGEPERFRRERDCDEFEYDL